MSLLLTMLGGGTAWTVNVSDTITLSDARAKSIGKPRSDSIVLSDSVIKSVGKARADTVTLVDASTKAINKPQSDTITLADAHSKAVGKPLSDTITLSDNISVIVPPLPPFPPVFLGGGGTEIGHPRMKVLKLERGGDDIEELEIVEILTCWLGKN
jgi:hypothetical protein